MEWSLTQLPPPRPRNRASRVLFLLLVCSLSWNIYQTPLSVCCHPTGYSLLPWSTQGFKSLQLDRWFVLWMFFIFWFPFRWYHMFLSRQLFRVHLLRVFCSSTLTSYPFSIPSRSCQFLLKEQKLFSQLFQNVFWKRVSSTWFQIHR